MSNLLEQASLVLIPSGYKEDVVYSEIPLDGSGDLTFTRASDGTRINSAGLVENCPWNLLSNSQAFSLWNTVAISNTVTITDNFTTAPNGTLTAAKVVFGTFDGSGQIFQNFSLTVTQNLVSTLYAKVPSGTKQAWFGFYDGNVKTQLKTLTTEWQRIEYTGSIDATTIRACWFYGEGGASNVEVHLWGGQLNIGSTAKPYFPTTNRQDVPRLTYQNGGGGCPSLLLEKQSTNLALYSEEFDNAAWIKYQGGTITANTAISPDGTQNADTLNVVSGNYYSGIYQSISASSDVYTLSIFAKKSTKRWLYLFDASASAAAWFDLENGVLGIVPSTYTASIENFGNGWYRCIFKKDSAVTPAFFQIGLSDANAISQPSSNGSAYIYGAQLEASSYATSYIPTQGSSVTRLADACYKTGISSLIGQTEGVIFVDYNYLPHEPQTILAIENWVTNNTVIRILSDTNTSITAQVYYAGNQYITDFNSAVFGQRYKCALAYKNNDFAFYINGVQISTSSSGTVPTTQNLQFGAFVSGQSMDGQINQAVIFKTRLTNAELASLTTL